MKQFKTPIILLAVILVLGGVAYWDEWKTGQEEAAEKTKNKLFSFTPDRVSEISYARKKNKEEDNDVHLTLKKEGENWSLTSPLHAKADQEGVKRFLNSIIDYQYERVAADTGDDWQKFGLSDPAVKVALKAGEESITFLLGDNAPVGFATYTAVAGKPQAYIGSQYIRTALQKTTDDFRDRNLVEIRNEELTYITFSRPGQGIIEFRPSEKQEWEIVRPAQYRLDLDDFWDFVAALKQEKATGFIDNPEGLMKKAFAENNRGTEKIASLTWQLKGEEPRTLTFLKNNNELYATYDPDKLVYKLAENFTKKLAKTLMDFRYRQVFEFESVSVTGVELDGKAFIKQNDQWFEGEQKNKAASFISKLLVDLEFAKAKAFKESSSGFITSLGEPAHKAKLEFEDPKQAPITLEIWKDKKDAAVVYLKHSAANQIYIAESKILKNISAEAAAEVETDDHGDSEEHDHNHG